jgi:hypothetical protein
LNSKVLLYIRRRIHKNTNQVAERYISLKKRPFLFVAAAQKYNRCGTGSASLKFMMNLFF